MSTGEAKIPGWVFGLGCGTIALVLLCISIALPLTGCGPAPVEPSYTPPAPTYTPTPYLILPTDTPTAPLAKMMVEAEWPERMEIDESDYIRVSLVRTQEGTFIPTVEVAGHTVVAATARPVGTLEAPIERAFGPAYKASAVARLEGTAFEISPADAEYQSLDEDRITWDWNILSVKPGHQTVNACIIVRWQPIEGTWDTIERTIWRAPLTIVVQQPWIKTDLLVQLVLGSGLLGCVFSAPWLYQKARERGERQRKVPYPVSVRRQLAETRENLRLIQERKSQYVLETDIPLQMIKEERRLLKRIEALEQHIEELE